jgi:transposase InsO family protein
VKYAWIKEYSKRFQVSVMCRVLKVDKSSYYRWIKEGEVVKRVDKKLNELIKMIFVQGRENYGTRRIKVQLLKRFGFIVSRRRIGTIMKDLGLKAKTKKRYKINTTDSNHNLPTALNILNRDFNASTPDEKYVGDITYIPTNEGWLYLATVIDLYSRRIVGWSMDDNMRVSLVNNALNMAITNRNPSKGLIWHTDRGSHVTKWNSTAKRGHYASYSHKDLLSKHGIIQSMSRKGNCWDNAVAESFFHTLKTELVYHEIYETRAQANQSIFEYIEVYYNRQRSHSTNNYLSPVEFEDLMLQNEMVA